MPELVVSLKGRELSRHSLGARTRVGRDPALEVVIDNPGVSRHHATIAYEAGQYVIRDENSQNGMFVSEQRMTQHVLAEGCVIQLGKFELAFSNLNVAPQGAMASEQGAVRAPGMVKTFALNAVEVQSVLAAHAASKANAGRAPAEDPLALSESTAASSTAASASTWFIAAGCAVVAAVLAVGLFVFL